MGTALNKILKDMITRFHQMNGKTQYMFRGGTVMDYQLNGRLRNNTKKEKK